ncbi:gastrin/cholecystokinin-like peptide [Arapaima gigas]
MTGRYTYVCALLVALAAPCSAAARARATRGHDPLGPWSAQGERADSPGDQRVFISRQILQAISELMNKEGCSVSEPFSERDYQGWMDFGRRSAEEPQQN